MEKKNTKLSKISFTIVILNYVLLIIALIAHKIGLGATGAAFTF